VLASASPQRRAILQRLGVSFSVRAPDVEELLQGDPALITLENARRKVHAVRVQGANEAVLGCDTVVSLDGAVYGKPADARTARDTLRVLSGRTHEVLSGLVLLLPDGERAADARTEVSFRELDEATIDWYVNRGEWRQRAGGYAIQGAGAALVRAVCGDYENVVGLPLARLLDVYPELLPGC
jgi:septum formation protein